MERWALLLALLATSVHSPSICEDRLGVECSTFSTMGECRGRRREWMQKNCALSCGVCTRPASAPDAHDAAQAPKSSEDWTMYVVELNDAAMLARFRRSNKRSLVLFHTHGDNTASARSARIAFADAAAGNVDAGVATDAAALDAAASLRYAAVGCDAFDKAVCSDFTSGGSILPAVWCFANGNWTEGPPIRLSFEIEMSPTAAATLSAASIQGFGARCVAAWDGHSDRIHTSRYVSSRAAEAEASMPPPLAPRRSLDQDRPPSMLGEIRDESKTSAPKKAMDMEYVPHVSENQGLLPRKFRGSGEHIDGQRVRGGDGGPSPEKPQHTKKLKSLRPKSSSLILEESDLRSKPSMTAAMRRVDKNIRETVEQRRERRVKEILAEKAQKKQEAKDAAEAAIAKARQPPPPPQPTQSSQQFGHEKSEKTRETGNVVSSTGRAGNAGKISKQRRGEADMPPDLSYAVQRATAVHGPLETSGLARLLSGVDMGRYARGLEDLGVTMPQELKKVSDQQLQALGMRPAEQRKLRKISEKAVIQGHGQMAQTAGGSMQRPRTHTDL